MIRECDAPFSMSLAFVLGACCGSYAVEKAGRAQVLHKHGGGGGGERK